MDSVFENGNFAGARLVFCERFDEKSDIWNLDRHEHSFIELLYFIDGGARIIGDKDDLILSVFDLVVYPENFSHQEDIDLTHRQEIVCLGIQFPRESGLERIHRLSDIDNRLRWLFVEIHSQFNGEYQHRGILVQHLVSSLLHYINDYLNVDRTEHDPISRAIQYINRNLAEKISVEDLAQLSNYSPSYLDRQFKKRTGMTPIRYLDQVRLKAATRLLARRDIDISQVASLIGYDDPKYFSRRFSTRYGIPPSIYRKRLEG